MTIDLSEVNFTYDFFSTTMPDGSLLVLNKIDEDFFDTEGTSVKLNHVNIIVQPVNEENSILCPSVVGIGNKYLKLCSDYAELQGKVLDTDTMKYCTIELYEDVE